MTPAKFILMLVVIVGVVYGVSFAVQERTRDQRVDPKDSWTSRLGRLFDARQRVDLQKDFAPSANLREGKLVFPVGVLRVELIVTERKGRRVRKAKFENAPQVFSIHYKPSSKDPRAMPLDVKDLGGKKSAELVFFEHGGQLIVTRTLAKLEAAIEIR